MFRTIPSMTSGHGRDGRCCCSRCALWFRDSVSKAKKHDSLGSKAAADHGLLPND